MKNQIPQTLKLNRAQTIEQVKTYLTNSNDCLIFLINDLMFNWHDRFVGKNTVYKSYQTIRATGEFDGNFDYGRGILQLTISSLPNYEDNTKFDFHLGITNVDDGNWDCNKTFDTLEECNKFLEEFRSFWANNVDDLYGKVLPSEQELNLILCEIGLWGERS